jgi:uncharacterized protein YjbJ (UPF0337 family)
MTTYQLESTWDTLKGKLKQRYGQLTDDDLTFAEGKGEELLGRLQAKLGISRAELEWTLDDLAATAEGNLEQAKGRAAEFSDQVRDVMQDVKQRATAIGEDAKAKGAAAYDEARQRARGLLDEGEQYVRTNPRESILAAVVAGFVAGIVVFRR